MADKYQVSYKGSEIYLPEEVEKLFDRVRSIDELIESLEKQKKEIETPLKEAMLTHGIEKFKCKYMTATLVKGAPYYTFDKDAMLRDGVFSKYATQKKKKDSVRILYKKGDTDEI